MHFANLVQLYLLMLSGLCGFTASLLIYIKYDAQVRREWRNSLATPFVRDMFHPRFR